MQFPIEDILALRLALTNEYEMSLPLTLAKCGDLSEAVEAQVPGKPEITQRYLYEYLFHRLDRAEKQEISTYGLNVNYVEKLVRCLGFQGVEDWMHRKRIVSPGSTSDQLASMLGIYECYVRCNSGREDVIKSPLKIYELANSIQVELRGAVRVFNGTPVISQGCMFVTLDSHTDKQFHWVCKIGNSRTPDVIQYIYSGVSAGGDPIGGKGVIVRVKEIPYDACTNERLPLDQLASSSYELDQSIFAYFTSQAPTVFKIEKVSTFDQHDLRM
ncbi:MAG: hypothetical protein AAF587_18805 [Bacteroidota bacterium]